MAKYTSKYTGNQIDEVIASGSFVSGKINITNEIFSEAFDKDSNGDLQPVDTIYVNNNIWMVTGSSNDELCLRQQRDFLYPDLPDFASLTTEQLESVVIV